jgi:hypothetical protein
MSVLLTRDLEEAPKKVRDLEEVPKKARDLEEAPKKARKTPTAGLAFQYAHKAVALGILYLANKGLYRACASASIKFPSPLIGAPSPHLLISHWCYSARLFPVSCHIATTACWAAV